MLDREELTDCIMLAASEKDKAILLWIWLSFDEIRQSSDDFEGDDRTFDIVLTLKDFQNMPA
jgi:hypothetical protein